ncbi:MAG: TonB-dependent siderophore receptor, partial [Puniceicoccaceae bacterium]
VNIISKKPLTYAFQEWQASYSSYGNYKVTADINQPLNKSKTINFRFNGAHTEGDNYYDLEKLDNWTFVPTLSISLWKNRINWRLEAEKSRIHRINAAHSSMAGSWGETGIGEATLTPPDPNRNFGGMVGLHPASFPEMNIEGPGGFVDQRARIFTSDLSVKVTDWLTIRQVNNWMDDDQWRQFASETDHPRFTANTFRSKPGEDAFYIVNGSGIKDTRARGIEHVQARLRNDEQTHQTEVLLEFPTGPIEHRILGGYEYKGVEFSITVRDAADDNLYSYDMRTREYIGEVTQEFQEDRIQQFSDTENDAYYANWQMGFFDGRIKTLAGIRNDRGGIVDGEKNEVTNPSFGIVYQPNDAWSFFAGYSEAAKPSSVRERGNDPDSPLLPRETGVGKEVGLRFNFFDNKVIGNLMAFDLVKENIPSQLDTGIYVSTGEQEAKGVEFDIMVKPADDLQVIFNLSYIESEVISDETYPLLVGKPMHNTPEWQWNLAFNKSFLEGPLEGLKLVGGIKYVGGGRLQWDPLNGVFGENFILGNYTVVDLGAQYKWTRGKFDYQISLNAKNLFDEFYVISRLYGGAPMELVAAFKVRF